MRMHPTPHSTLTFPHQLAPRKHETTPNSTSGMLKKLALNERKLRPTLRVALSTSSRISFSFCAPSGDDSCIMRLMFSICRRMLRLGNHFLGGGRGFLDGGAGWTPGAEIGLGSCTLKQAVTRKYLPPSHTNQQEAGKN